MGPPTYVVNVEGAVCSDGKYLLIERAASEDHAAGQLAFPGGKVEEAADTTDPIEGTVRRELYEEVGVEVGTVEYVHSRYFESDTGHPVINILTVCSLAGGTPHPREPQEVAAVHWLSQNEIIDHANAPPYLERDVAVLEARPDTAVNNSPEETRRQN